MNDDPREFDDRTKRIAFLNDHLRKTFSASAGVVLLTSGLKATFDRQSLIKLGNTIKAFRDFNNDNDPYGEHDFGTFEFEGETINWKIDYYAPDLIHGSEDPSDPKQTKRVLTIMLAADY